MTNDLISRKALLELFEHHTWFFTSDIIKNINFAPAIQQCGEGEPIGKYNTRVGSTVIYNHKKLQNDFELTELPLFTYPPDQTARIDELQKQNEKLREALVVMKDMCVTHIAYCEYIHTCYKHAQEALSEGK